MASQRSQNDHLNRTSKMHPPTKTKPNSRIARIVSKAEVDSCGFWIGLFHSGKLSPTDLWACSNTIELFEEAATNGITEQGPVMMSDSVSQPARFVYLLPSPPSEERNTWLKQIVDTLKTWEPQRVGLYISPKVLDHSACDQLLQQVLKELLVHTSIKEFCVLPGKHGTNLILNSLLQLKFDIEAKNLDLLVMH
jgi:hypothetical protein